METRSWDDLVGHLTRTTPLPADMATRVVEEVVAYFNESAEGFVRRRHRELQEAGHAQRRDLPADRRRAGGSARRRP